MLKYFGLAVLIMAFAEAASLSAARAVCSTETKAHLSMAIDSYKEWETYSGESTDTSDELARTEWNNFEHQMDWINDHGRIRDCLGSTTERLYYIYSARQDSKEVIEAFTTWQAGEEGASSDELKQIVNSALDVYYQDVSMLYYLGYAKTNAGEYAYWKQDIKNWFAKMRRRFRQWENTPRFSAASPSEPIVIPRSSCSMPDRGAVVTTTVDPIYPASARDSDVGHATVQVNVTVGPTGKVTRLDIAQSSGNTAIDDAALQAARESTYSPAIKNCQPTTGTLLFYADLQPE
ncbi:MAG TPA: energy transducer TonB [Candidatus Cybelea sp.]|nr:energy transducer TonB [Candidatus Cybelea sp.]